MCPDDEVWVADADGNPLPRGEVGRLMTRGPYTFRGLSLIHIYAQRLTRQGMRPVAVGDLARPVRRLGFIDRFFIRNNHIGAGARQRQRDRCV